MDNNGIFQMMDQQFAQEYRALDPHLLLRKPSAFEDGICCIFEGKRDGEPFYLAPGLRFRPGEVTLWGGINGHGKSLITGQLAMQLAEKGEKACVMSLEMAPDRTLMRMCRQWLGHFPKSVGEIHNFVNRFEELIRIYDYVGAIDLELLFGAVVVAKKMYCSHVFIDNLMRCTRAEDDYASQKFFVQELCSLARRLKIHIHLVHHVRKGKDEAEEIGKFSFKGTGAIVDQVDNAILIQRNRVKEKRRLDRILTPAEDHTEGDSVLRIVKQRNGDFEGDIPLWFNAESAAFCASPDRRTPWGGWHD